jgi:hypothetical protein
MNVDPCTVSCYAMQLTHETNRGLDMLNHMTRVYLAEDARPKGIRVTVQIVNNIDTLDRIAIHAYGSGNFFSSTTQIQGTLHKRIPAVWMEVRLHLEV